MPIRNRHRPGDWLYRCQRCGFTKYASEVQKEWTGLRVCSDCWEPRHPQEFVRGRVDDIAPPYANPPRNTFLDTQDVSYAPDQIISQDGEVVIADDDDFVVAES